MNQPTQLKDLQQATAGTFGSEAPFHAPVASSSAFNPEAYHAMQERDDQLIRDSILHGYAGEEYIYSFWPKGAKEKVVGVSVVGARELACYYGGIKARIVASVDKTASLFIFKSFEPMGVQVQMIPQLADEDDFYEVVMEVTDLKTGNSLQVRKKETKMDKRKDGTPYARQHYDVIAESKAFRNGVLSVIPQNVISAFKERCLKSGKVSQEQTLDDLKENVLLYATKNSIPLDRAAINNLLYSEISGLGGAARESIDSFREACTQLGVEAVSREKVDHSTGEIKQDDPKPTEERQRRPRRTKEQMAAARAEEAAKKEQQAATQGKPDDPPPLGETGREPSLQDASSAPINGMDGMDDMGDLE